MKGTFGFLAKKVQRPASVAANAATAATLPSAAVITPWQQALLVSQAGQGQAGTPWTTEGFIDDAKEAFARNAEVAKQATAKTQDEQVHEGDVSSKEWRVALAEYKAPKQGHSVQEIFSQRAISLHEDAAASEAMEKVFAEMNARDRQYFKDWENAENRVSYAHKVTAERTLADIAVLGEKFFSCGTIPHDLRVSTPISRNTAVEFYKYTGPTLLFTPKSGTDDVTVYLVSDEQSKLAERTAAPLAAVGVKGFNQMYSLVLNEGDIIGLPEGSKPFGYGSKVTSASHCGFSILNNVGSCFKKLPEKSVELTGIVRSAEDVQCGPHVQVT